MNLNLNKNLNLNIILTLLCTRNWTEALVGTLILSWMLIKISFWTGSWTRKETQTLIWTLN